MIDPAFGFVTHPAAPGLHHGQADSLEATIEVAERMYAKAIRDVFSQLNESGSQANPNELDERIREVRRVREVLDNITGLQVALSAAGKS